MIGIFFSKCILTLSECDSIIGCWLLMRRSQSDETHKAGKMMDKGTWHHLCNSPWCYLERFFCFFSSVWKTDHLEAAQINTKRLHEDVAECTVIHCSQKTGWHKSHPLLSPWQRGFRLWETSHLVFLPAAGRPKLKRDNGQQILLMFGGRTWTYVRFSGQKKKNKK